MSDAVVRLAVESEAAPLVTQLRTWVHTVLTDEIARARRRASSDAEAARTEAAMRHLVGVLLHQPTTHLHQAVAQGRTSAALDALELLGMGPAVTAAGAGSDEVAPEASAS